jgi:UDP-glucose 4-epimerase
MKKILITGSSGYIGSHLCKMLEGQYEIHGLDVNMPKAPVDRFYKQDINRLFEPESEYDAVIHLAALVRVGESEHMPIQYYITNLNGTMNILNRVKTKNFIFASTGTAEYCQSVYGTSKRAAEDVIREYCTLRNKQDYSIFRFYNVIGCDGFAPTNPDGLMYKLFEATDTNQFTIYGNDYDVSPDGTCVRDYVHVNEVCEALKLAIEKPANKIECLGHGVGHTVREIVNVFQKVNDIDFDVVYGPRRKGDLPSSVLEDVSPYMKNLYSIEELLKLP